MPRLEALGTDREALTDSDGPLDIVGVMVKGGDTGRLTALARLISRHERQKMKGAKLVFAMALGLVSLTLITPAGATLAATPPVVLTFHGSTSSDLINGKDFTYGFTVPIDHRFAVSWATSTYPPGAHGANRTFSLDVGAYGEPNNVPCGARDMWCGPGTTPPAGSQTFFAFGSGRFGIGIIAAETHWVIKVTITPVPPALIPPKPTGPGIGATIAIAAKPGAYGAYHVTLLRVYNTLGYDFEGFPASGSHPLVARFLVNDTGSTSLDEDPQSDANALLLGHDYPAVPVVEWTGTGKVAGTWWELESDFENPKTTTGYIDGMNHTGCPAPSAPGRQRVQQRHQRQYLRLHPAHPRVRDADLRGLLVAGQCRPDDHEGLLDSRCGPPAPAANLLLDVQQRYTDEPLAPFPPTADVIIGNCSRGERAERANIHHLPRGGG